MANPFLSSEEYDERAHRQYDTGDYEGALETLKEGLQLYPHSVELYVGLGYTRLAREEFVWARQNFEKALVLDGEHEDGLVGLGEVMLRFGRRHEALDLFERAREIGCSEDLDLLLSMGRALYRERMFEHAKETFIEAVRVHHDSAEAVAALGYTMHRLGDETAARTELRAALELDADLHEARIYLAHLLYDAGDWGAAAREFERVPLSDQWDSLAVWRLIELKRAMGTVEAGSAEMTLWEERLEELESDLDPIDDLLAEIEGGSGEPETRTSHPADAQTLHLRLRDGRVCSGSYSDILTQLRDACGRPDETVAQFMQRHAAEERMRSGVELPVENPEEFILTGARAGLWSIDT
ncbi:MAG TPA: tetratricopeptide repeat protein [Longimicrobiales bacterium]|nr:tetratricopeptide repeat protein [Longimicrobiales bacterium]